MLGLRKALAAGVVTDFSFAYYDSSAVLVKNETSGELLFCDDQFNESKAIHVPPYSWQRVFVKVFPGMPPQFFVKAAAAGYVEIDMGSDGMGCCDMLQILDKAGMVPHLLTFSNDAETTLTVQLIRKHGESIDLEAPIPAVSGRTVYTGDILEFTSVCTAEGKHAVLKINGVDCELDEDGVFTHIVAAAVNAVCTAEADVVE
ncbi:MAG TPA: hypothetical protein PKB13_08800 [Clostridia bacterium]|nr:hypothetical protein [Clostridia bacterium]